MINNIKKNRKINKNKLEKQNSKNSSCEIIYLNI